MNSDELQQPIHRTYLRGVAKALKLAGMVVGYPLLMILEPVVPVLAMVVLLAVFLGPALAIAVHATPSIGYPFFGVFLGAYIVYAVFVLLPIGYIWDNRGGLSD